MNSARPLTCARQTSSFCPSVGADPGLKGIPASLNETAWWDSRGRRRLRLVRGSEGLTGRAGAAAAHICGRECITDQAMTLRSELNLVLSRVSGHQEQEAFHRLKWTSSAVCSDSGASPGKSASDHVNECVSVTPPLITAPEPSGQLQHQHVLLMMLLQIWYRCNRDPRSTE